jgi:sarcosine oxidase
VAEFAVVGAGLNGLATAWALDRAGHDVVVYEQFDLGHTRGSSHGRTRIFRLAYPDEKWVRFAQDALEGWRELEREAGEELLLLNGLLELYREGV